MTRWQAPDSFADFVRTRHPELLRFAHVLSGDRHLAEDLVQDALERTGMAWDRILRRDDPEGYVRRIITNRYLNRVRNLRREHLVADLPEPGRHDAGQLAARWPRAGRTRFSRSAPGQPVTGQSMTGQPMAGPDSPEVDELLWRLLAELPRAQRAVLVLRYFLDLTEAQAAAQLGCSVGTVKSNASRALAKLRSQMFETSVERVR